MHIMEGVLPLELCIFWFVVSLPFVACGMYQLNCHVKKRRDTLPLLAISGAFIFVFSSLKMPSVTGSCLHPTGTGLGTVIFGPYKKSKIRISVYPFGGDRS